MAKNVQVKIIDFDNQVKDWVGEKEKAKEMFDMFVVNCDSFSDFKIKTVLMIEIETGHVIDKFSK